MEMRCSTTRRKGNSQPKYVFDAVYIDQHILIVKKKSKQKSLFMNK